MVETEVPGAAAPVEAMPAAPVRRKVRGVGLPHVAAVAALIGVLCWGAWVTKTVASDSAPQGQLVKLQLQGVITEYLQAQARSSADERTAAAETARFMAELDMAVAKLGQSGRVVLVNEAVIGGLVPDITDEVKRQVYSKVPMPKIVSVPPVQADMQAYLDANGGSRGPRQ